MQSLKKLSAFTCDEEDLNDVPDDDQYDTEDSFVDDAELDEYFEVDNLKTKHDGYFVNKGSWIRFDYFDIGYVPGKSSARGTAKVGKQLASSNIGSYGQYHEDNRVVKNKTSGPGGAPRRKSSEFSVGDAAARAKVIKDVSDAPLELRDLEKQKAAPPPVSYAHKSKTSEAFDYAYPADRDKGTSAQLGFQQRKHPVVGRAGSCIKPKGTRLERGIRDLQKIAAESVKRRLPPEVKQKVARLSANQGKIQEHELMNRLMSIVGHLVQRRTL
ncbi:wound-responsive family protein [Zea mays]|uniref:Wound-responsive family protein n=1 Tax=Zea mays TaxID=4577 RepID=A0A1D6G7H5_MAIZE|nr:wound-responsive family protein [Zea mays]